MLRFAAVFWVAFCAVSTANDCMAGTADAVELLDWHIAVEGGTSSVSSTYENVTGRDIRMIRGSIMFSDPFGAFIGSVHMGPDVDIPAGAHITETNAALATPRLSTVRSEDITATACVLGLVYKDGTKEEF